MRFSNKCATNFYLDNRMNADSWTATVSRSEMSKRAGGRRAYNARRQSAAKARQAKIHEAIAEMNFNWADWRARAELARQFGVSRATITRDIQHILVEADCPEYAEAYRDFVKWHRKAEGQSLGPRPGTTFRQMRRK